MAAVGDQTVTTMLGRPAEATQAVQTIPAAPGEDRQRYRKLGLRAPEIDLRTSVAAADQTAAEALDTAYRALVGAAVTITDSHGTSHSNCMVLGVSVRIRPILADAAGNTRLVHAVWLVRKGEDVS